VIHLRSAAFVSAINRRQVKSGIQSDKIRAFEVCIVHFLLCSYIGMSFDVEFRMDIGDACPDIELLWLLMTELLST
jgi:hypothetical protein